MHLKVGSLFREKACKERNLPTLLEANMQQTVVFLYGPLLYGNCAFWTRHSISLTPLARIGVRRKISGIQQNLRRGPRSCGAQKTATENMHLKESFWHGLLPNGVRRQFFWKNISRSSAKRGPSKKKHCKQSIWPPALGTLAQTFMYMYITLY